MPDTHTSAGHPRHELVLLLALAGIQFTHILDFMIMMPLGPVFVTEFQISPQQFSLLVSSYTFAAAVSGVLAASFIDRFDRKHAVLATYACFLIATGLCALAPGYAALLVARALAGFFGGILGALVFTVVGDVVPEHRRGRAAGMLMGAFSMATVAGLPLGLWLAQQFSWHAPFVFIAALSVVVWEMARRSMPAIDAHVAASEAHRRHPLAPLLAVLRDPNHLRAFGFMTLLILSGFMVIPFVTLYYTSTVGVAAGALPLMYFLGGLCTLFTSRWFGRWSDRHGKAFLYRRIALGSLVPLFAITHLPAVPLWIALVVSTLFFVFVSGRMVPGMAMVTSAANPALRGAFMSLNASVTQLASGVASVIAGWIVIQADDGTLLHYDRAGGLAIGVTIVAMFVSRYVRPYDQRA